MEKRTFTKEDLSIALSRSGIDSSSVLTVQPKVSKCDLATDTRRNDPAEIEQLKSIIKALGAKVHSLLEEKNGLEKEAQRKISASEKALHEKNSFAQARENEIEKLQELLQLAEAKAAEAIQAKKAEALKPVPSPIRQDPTNTQAYLKVVFEKQQVEEEISALRCEKIATSRRMHDLVQENANLKKDLETLQLKSAHLEEELRDVNQKQQILQSHSDQLAHELLEQKQQTAQLAIDLKEKEQQLNSERAKSQENDTRIQSLEGKVFELAEALNVSQQKESLASSQCKERELELAALQEDSVQLQDAFRKKVEEVASLHELLAIRTQELDLSSTQLENQTLALHDQRKGNALLLEEHESIQSKFKETQEELAKTKDALRDVERELTRLKAALSKLNLAERLSNQLYELFRPHESDHSHDRVHERAYESTSFFEGGSHERPGSLF